MVNPKMPLFVEAPNGDIDHLPDYYELVTRVERQGYSHKGVPQRGPVKYAVRPLTSKEQSLLDKRNL